MRRGDKFITPFEQRLFKNKLNYGGKVINKSLLVYLILYCQGFFLCLLNKYLSNVKNLVIYFNNIMICVDTKKEHDTILKQIIEIARKNNIKFYKNR